MPQLYTFYTTTRKLSNPESESLYLREGFEDFIHKQIFETSSFFIGVIIQITFISNGSQLIAYPVVSKLKQWIYRAYSNEKLKKEVIISCVILIFEGFLF